MAERSTSTAERLATLAAEVKNLKEELAEHRDECNAFKKEVRDAIIEVKLTIAKWSGLAVFVIGVVSALAQIFTSQVLPARPHAQQEQRHQQNE